MKIDSALEAALGIAEPNWTIEKVESVAIYFRTYHNEGVRKSYELVLARAHTAENESMTKRLADIATEISRLQLEKTK